MPFFSFRGLLQLLVRLPDGVGLFPLIPALESLLAQLDGGKFGHGIRVDHLDDMMVFFGGGISILLLDAIIERFDGFLIFRLPKIPLFEDLGVPEGLLRVEGPVPDGAVAHGALVLLLRFGREESLAPQAAQCLNVPVLEVNATSNHGRSDGGRPIELGEGLLPNKVLGRGLSHRRCASFLVRPSGSLEPGTQIFDRNGVRRLGGCDTNILLLQCGLSNVNIRYR
mmetsp:Transcript_19597/g.47021  ORF Transcript_19597/g.47021 Transcript_19597/m.47021 type:complete len:225 (-) Transcript_19597:1340-2014(-)